MIAHNTLSLVLVLLFTAPGQDLRVGDAAPDFSLSYATRDSVARVPLTLSDVVSKGATLLAFYPADWSSGCTREVCSFRDDIVLFEELDIQVLGISGDYVYSHHAWAKHHDLPFRLLSDHTHDVARAYGTFNEESGYNRRSVFLLSSDRTILYMDDEYSVRDNADYEALKQAIRNLQ